MEKRSDWTLEEVEEALIACHELWRRSPGGGRWPFAGDGPWQLIQGEDGDFGGDGVDGASSSVRPRPPLDAAEVGERDRVTAWLQWIGDVDVRKAVWLATWAFHHGEPHAPWMAIARAIRWTRSANALAGRYRMALAAITCRLNGWPMNRVRALAHAPREAA